MRSLHAALWGAVNKHPMQPRLGPYFWMCCFFVMKKALPGRLVPGSGPGGFGACVAGANARALAAAVLLLAPRGPSAGAAFGAASACGASLGKSTAAGPPGAGAAFGAVSTSGRTLGNSTMAGNPSTDAAAFASLRRLASGGRVLNCLCRIRTHLRRARVVSNVLKMSGRISRLRNFARHTISKLDHIEQFRRLQVGGHPSLQHACLTRRCHAAERNCTQIDVT